MSERNKKNDGKTVEMSNTPNKSMGETAKRNSVKTKKQSTGDLESTKTRTKIAKKSKFIWFCCFSFMRRRTPEFIVDMY